MAVTKKKVVAVKKAATPVAETTAPKKAAVAKPVAKKAETKAVATKTTAPKKAAVAKPVAEKKAGKKFLSKTSKNTDSFKLVEGKQATQDQYIAILHKKLTALGYGEVTKEEVRNIQKACSETLAEVTNLCSFQDTTANIYYARREIDSRVTNPPKAADGLQTLMLKHYELKVRKVLANEDEIKFSGTVSEEDPSIFITTDGQEIKINSVVSPVAATTDEEDTDEEAVDETVEDEEVAEDEAVDEEVSDDDEELLEDEDEE